MSHGVTQDAMRLSRDLSERYANSVLWMTKNRLRSEIDRIRSECSTVGWDGYDARVLGPRAVGQALSFVEALPHTLAPPSVVPDPDGVYGFEWYTSPEQVFSVSVEESGVLHFAGLFGAEKRIRGRARISNPLPEEIMIGIRQALTGGKF